MVADDKPVTLSYLPMVEKKPTKKKAVKYGVYSDVTARHGRCWCYRVRITDADGKVKMKAASGFTTKPEADEAVSKLRLDSRARQHGIEVVKPVAPPTISEAVEGYVRAISARWRAEHGDTYVARNSGQINALRRWVEFAGEDRVVNTLTKDDLAFWVEHEVTRGVTRSTARRRINSIVAALNHAKEIRPELAAWRTPKRPLGKEVDQPRMRILSPSEIKALSDALQSRSQWRDAHDFFRIALGTGGRFDEIVAVVERANMNTAGIQWEHVDEAKGTLRLYSHKTDKWRTLHVPAVVSILAKRKADELGSDVHAFVCRDHNLRAAFAAASKQCEIPFGRTERNGWAAHDLRHTCLTHLLQSGVDIATVRDFAGHADIKETAIYVHATSESRQRAAAASSALVALANS